MLPFITIFSPLTRPHGKPRWKVGEVERLLSPWEQTRQRFERHLQQGMEFTFSARLHIMRTMICQIVQAFGIALSFSQTEFVKWLKVALMQNVWKGISGHERGTLTPPIFTTHGIVHYAIVVVCPWWNTIDSTQAILYRHNLSGFSWDCLICKILNETFSLTLWQTELGFWHLCWLQTCKN